MLKYIDINNPNEVNAYAEFMQFAFALDSACNGAVVTDDADQEIDSQVLADQLDDTFRFLTQAYCLNSDLRVQHATIMYEYAQLRGLIAQSVGRPPLPGETLCDRIAQLVREQAHNIKAPNQKQIDDYIAAMPDGVVNPTHNLDNELAEIAQEGN